MSARLEMSENSTSLLLYRAMFKARVQAAVAMATAVKNAPPPASKVHPGVQGQIREILVRELFRPLLPPDIGVGTGQLIDRCNNLSPETDIILFDRRLAPPMMLNESLGLFPIESCLFVVEVKTTLDSGNLKNSHKAALRIREIDFNNLASSQTTVKTKANTRTFDMYCSPFLVTLMGLNACVIRPIIERRVHRTNGLPPSAPP
jgi:hypothetical protein